MDRRETLYRRNGKNVYIKQPEYEELEFVRELWADRDTMKDIGGVFDFSENKWEMFYKKMVLPTDGNNFYCLIYNNEDKPVGEVSFHGYDSITKIARFNIKVYSKYRNKGYGEEAIRLLLEYYFIEFGGEIIMDNIITPEGERMATKLGFEELRKYNDKITIRLTKDDFLNFDKGTITNIGIIMMDNMDMLDYSMAKELFEKSNAIIGKKRFNLYEISTSDKLNIAENIKVSINKNQDKRKLNVLIIPGSNYMLSRENSRKITESIINHYNECDFICALNEGIYYLASSKELKGVLVPVGEWTNNLDIENKSVRLVDTNYIDNGKLMLSTNMMGTLELYLNLIKKIGGNDLEEKLKAEIGLKK